MFLFDDHDNYLLVINNKETIHFGIKWNGSCCEALGTNRSTPTLSCIIPRLEDKLDNTMSFKFQALEFR